MRILGDDMMNTITIIRTGADKPKSVNFAALTFAAVSILGSQGVATTANADNLYKTSFEQPTFVANDVLAGLDGWLDPAVLPPFLNPTIAKVTDTIAKSGKQSVEVSGANLVSAVEVDPYAAVAISRRPLDANGYTLTGRERYARVDADLRIATTKPKTNGEFFSQTISTRAGDGNTLGEIGLSSAGLVEAWGFGAGPGDAPTFTSTIRLNKWYHITILHDFNQDTTTYYIDEHRLGQISTPSDSRTLLRGAIGTFARPDDTSPDVGSFRDDYKARFDKFRISVHSIAPEID
jgi:hypothetical protein